MKPVDITGQVFGKLTAIERVDKRTQTDRSIYWRCICACGREKFARQSDLRQGKSTSCGCNRLKRIPPVRPPNKYIQFISDEADRQKITRAELARRSGVDPNTLRKGCRGIQHNQRVCDIDALLEVLGYKLQPVRMEKPDAI